MARSAPYTPVRVLLVDDHEDTVVAQAMLLRRRGYVVSIARDAAEALRAAEQGPLDVVVSDLGLPDRDGMDLMRELSSRYGLPGIAVSGRAEPDPEHLAAAGFGSHLVKPASVEQLVAAIDAAGAPHGDGPSPGEPSRL